MGNRTVVHIYNDGFSDIEAHPEEFVKNLVAAAMRGGEIPTGSHANVAQVMASEHDSYPTTFFAREGVLLKIWAQDPKTQKWIEDPRLRRKLSEWLNVAKAQIQALQDACQAQEAKL